MLDPVFRQEAQVKAVEAFDLNLVTNSFTYGHQWARPDDGHLQPVLMELDYCINSLKEAQGTKNVFIHEHGCGGGRWTREIAKHAGPRCEYTVSDGTPEAHEITKKYVSLCGLPIPIKCYVGLPAPLVPYHFLFSFDTLVHFDDQLLKDSLNRFCQLVEGKGSICLFNYANADHADPELKDQGSKWFNYRTRSDMQDIFDPRGFDLQSWMPLVGGYGSELVTFVRR